MWIERNIQQPVMKMKDKFPVLLFTSKSMWTKTAIKPISSYLERDVRNILNIKDLRDFTVFLKLLATYSGQILNMSNLSRDLGMLTTPSNHGYRF